MESRSAREIELPFVHAKVKLDDLKPNGKLFADDEIEPLIATFNAKREYYKANPRWGEQGIIKNNEERKQFGCRLKKSELNSRFGVIQFEDNYFAIYRGVKQNHHLGDGGYGYTKLVQNIRTGEWAVIKLCKMAYGHSCEFKMLKKLGMGYGQLERIAGYGSHFLRTQGPLKTLNQNNIVMKLAPGMTLAEYRDLTRANSDIKRIHVCLRVLEALQRLHEHRIIHGDISLKNVFYDDVEDHATLIDYGVAKRKPKFGNPNGELVITNGYYAPELNPHNYSKHKKHFTYSFASDMFAVGATLSYFLSAEGASDCGRLQDDRLRATVALFCGMRLCAEKAGDRPTIQQAITFFQEKKKLLLNMTCEPIKKIALISLAEYRHLLASSHQLIQPQLPEKIEQSEEKHGFFSFLSGIFAYSDLVPNTVAQEDAPERTSELFSNYCKQLQLFDQVWFIDGNQSTDLDYITIRRALEDHDIVLGNRCFIDETNDKRQMLHHVLRQIHHASYSKLNKLYFVTTDKEMIWLSNEFKDSICMMPVTQEWVLEKSQSLINQFVEADIYAEFQVLLDGLRLLINHYHNANATNAIEVCMLALEANFKMHQLSCTFIFAQLALLRETLERLSVLPVEEIPRFKHSSFFAHHHDSGVKHVMNELDKVETQFKIWSNSYQ